MPIQTSRCAVNAVAVLFSRRRAEVIRRAIPALAVLAIFLSCSPGFSISPSQNPNDPGKEPSDLKGVKVYHLPEKSAARSKGDLAVAHGVSYQEINIDHLALNLFVRMNPVDRSATVLKVYFQDLRANGLPVHIEPYNTEFHLSRNEAVELPSPLRLSFTFAEIDSLEPFRRLVSQDVLRLTGKLFILVQLNTLEAIVLRSRQVVLPFDLDQTVPMHMFTDERAHDPVGRSYLDQFSFRPLFGRCRRPGETAPAKSGHDARAHGCRDGASLPGLLRLFVAQP
jgi:hypothetical protein